MTQHQLTAIFVGPLCIAVTIKEEQYDISSVLLAGMFGLCTVITALDLIKEWRRG